MGLFLDLIQLRDAHNELLPLFEWQKGSNGGQDVMFSNFTSKYVAPSAVL